MHCMYESHRGFATIYDGHSLKFVLHRGLELAALHSSKVCSLRCDGLQCLQWFGID